MKAGGWALVGALGWSACAEAMPPLGAVPVAPPPALGPTPSALRSVDAQTLQRLQTSLEKWRLLREQVNAYRYQVVFESYTGFRSVTTVHVRGHRVVERRHESQTLRSNPLELQWLETGQDVNMHPGAIPALTLDELYNRAREVLSRPLSPHEHVSLGIDRQGLLQHCYILDTRLADDAPREGVPPLRLELN